MPFGGIIEAYVLRTLRDAGFSMADIRLAVETVREDFESPYALASQRIATDGVDLFVSLANDELITPHGARPIREVIDPYLRFIEWDETGHPNLLRLSRYPASIPVVIDPRFAGGSPVLEVSKTPIAAVVELWRAGEPMAIVAKEFDLTQNDVENICRVAA